MINLPSFFSTLASGLISFFGCFSTGFLAGVAVITDFFGTLAFLLFLSSTFFVSSLGFFSVVFGVSFCLLFEPWNVLLLFLSMLVGVIGFLIFPFVLSFSAAFLSFDSLCSSFISDMSVVVIDNFFFVSLFSSFFNLKFFIYINFFTIKKLVFFPLVFSVRLPFLSCLVVAFNLELFVVW